MDIYLFTWLMACQKYAENKRTKKVAKPIDKFGNEMMIMQMNNKNHDK